MTKKVGGSSLSPVEYEILFALFQLKERGFSEVTLRDVRHEANQRRKQQGIESLSIQHVYYYLRKLSRRPFVKRRNENRVSKYSLVKGTWKLKQSPPLCIHINDVDFVLICDRVAQCRKEPNMKCVEYLVNRGQIRLPQTVKVAKAS